MVLFPAFCSLLPKGETFGTKLTFASLPSVRWVEVGPRIICINNLKIVRWVPEKNMSGGISCWYLVNLFMFLVMKSLRLTSSVRWEHKLYIWPVSNQKEGSFFCSCSS